MRRGGQFFVGESGTELLFRLIMNACLARRGGGHVLGSTAGGEAPGQPLGGGALGAGGRGWTMCSSPVTASA